MFQDVYLTLVNNAKVVKLRIHPLSRGDSATDKRFEKLRFFHVIDTFANLITSADRVNHKYLCYFLTANILTVNAQFAGCQ